MKRGITNDGHTRRAQARLRMIQHYEAVTRNVSKTCRFFGISRNQFYRWLRRYQREGVEGLRGPSSTASHLTILNAMLRDRRPWQIA